MQTVKTPTNCSPLDLAVQKRGGLPFFVGGACVGVVFVASLVAASLKGPLIYVIPTYVKDVGVYMFR